MCVCVCACVRVCVCVCVYVCRIQEDSGTSKDVSRPGIEPGSQELASCTITAKVCVCVCVCVSEKGER